MSLHSHILIMYRICIIVCIPLEGFFIYYLKYVYEQNTLNVHCRIISREMHHYCKIFCLMRFVFIINILLYRRKHSYILYIHLYLLYLQSISQCLRNWNKCEYVIHEFAIQDWIQTNFSHFKKVDFISQTLNLTLFVSSRCKVKLMNFGHK